MTAKKTTKKVTKKTTKKAAPKKRVVKKKVTKPITVEQEFVLVNGQRLQHYIMLADVLEELEDAVVAHHVNDVKHDFANWVRYVFEEEDLARELEGVQEKKEMRLIIYKHLVKKHLN